MESTAYSRSCRRENPTLSPRLSLSMVFPTTICVFLLGTSTFIPIAYGRGCSLSILQK